VLSRRNLGRVHMPRLVGLDQLLSVLGILAGFPSLLLAYSKDLPIGVPLVLLVSCGAYLFVRRAGILYGNTDSVRPSIIHLDPWILHLSFVVLYCLSVIELLRGLYIRSLLYFLILTAMSGQIALEILTSGERSERSLQGTVLPKILLLALNLQLGRYYSYPTIFGIDPFAHAFYVQHLIETGHILTNTTYTTFPGAHLIVATVGLVAALSSLKLDLCVAIGFVSVIGLIVVSKTARLFVGVQGSLIATLLASLATFLVSTRVELDSQGLALVLFAYFFWMLMRSVIPRSKRTLILLEVLFIVSIVITHALSSLILLVVLATTAVVLVVRRNYAQPGLVHMAILGILFVASYWIFASQLFDYSMNLMWETIKYATPLGFPLHFLSAKESDLAWSGTYVLYSLGIIGSLSFVSQRLRSTPRLALVSCVGVLLGTSYAFLVLLSSMAIIPERWYPFAMLMLVIPASSVSASLARKGRALPILLITLILCFAFLSIVSPFANDQPSFMTGKVMRLSFTTNELHAVAFLNATYDGPITTDMYYGEMLFALTFSFAERPDWTFSQYQPTRHCPQRLTEITTGMLAGSEPSSGLVILRMSAVDTPIRLLAGHTYAKGAYSPYYYIQGTYPLGFVQRLTSEGNVLYSSGSVIAVLVYSKSCESNTTDTRTASQGHESIPFDGHVVYP
jgi:hypothetical protein